MKFQGTNMIRYILSQFSRVIGSGEVSKGGIIVKILVGVIDTPWERNPDY
jgi:hypothetical protein